ncbi:E3 ubiquitin-protein ligase DCST1-like [Tetranychus urticae]|uniref:Dendritic cell-specific transmembrane protein-like domain-containing protein n=1 Tax=Tetranychus urticae TaxID=32264 RepID=T1KT98_TETUR|nr:E3 ubiquitin-protein ligase DCST1-like [Tetranychus urticae]
MVSKKVKYVKLKNEKASPSTPFGYYTFKSFITLLYKLALDPKGRQYQDLRRLLCFPWGLATGYLFYFACIQRLDFPDQLAQALLPITLLLYTIAYCLSIQFRTITWLLVPSLAGQVGRSFMYLTFFTIAISQPASNLVDNTFEASRNFMCTINYHRNVTVDHLRFTYGPYMQLLSGISQGGAKSVNPKTNFSKIALDTIKGSKSFEKNLTTNIKTADEKLKLNRIKTLSKKYEDAANDIDDKRDNWRLGAAKTLDLACENVLSSAYELCLMESQKMYNKCLGVWPSFLHFMCRPYNRSDDCESLSSDKDSELRQSVGKCDGLKTIPKNYGTAFVQLDGSAADIESQMKVKDVKYEVVGGPDWDKISPAAVEANLAKTYSNNKNVFSDIAIFLNRLLGALFLLTLWQANSYHNGYMRYIYFDNVYVTGYFRALDQRRSLAQRNHLLPLRRLEKSELVYPLSIKLTSQERKTRLMAILALIPLMFGAAVIVSFDYFFHELLSTSDEFFKQKTTIRGYQVFNFNFNPKSSFGKLLSGILKPALFNFTINTDEANDICLPNAKNETSAYYYLIAICGTGIILLALTQAHIHRFRRAICAYFYPTREKNRILYLYNDRLRKRQTYTIYQMRKIRQLVNDNAHWRDTALFKNFISRKTRFTWLKTMVTRYCTICETAEDEGSFQCHRCSVFYCSHCWKLVKKVCRACKDDPTDPPALTN